MNDVSREYSEALFRLASEQDKGQEYSDALELVKRLVVENPEYIDFMCSPGIPMHEREAALDAAFSGDEVMTSIASFLKLLMKNGRSRELVEIIDEYQAIFKSAIGVSTAYVTSAAPLNGAEMDALRKNLEKRLGHKVECVFSTDESLIGGIVVRVDGKVIDSSIKSQLSDIRELIK